MIRVRQHPRKRTKPQTKQLTYSAWHRRQQTKLLIKAQRTSESSQKISRKVDVAITKANKTLAELKRLLNPPPKPKPTPRLSPRPKARVKTKPVAHRKAAASKGRPRPASTTPIKKRASSRWLAARQNVIDFLVKYPRTSATELREDHPDIFALIYLHPVDGRWLFPGKIEEARRAAKRK